MYSPVLVEVFEGALLPTWARRLSEVPEMTVVTKDTQNRHDDQNKATYLQSSSSSHLLYLSTASCLRGSVNE